MCVYCNLRTVDNHRSTFQTSNYIKKQKNKFLTLLFSVDPVVVICQHCQMLMGMDRIQDMNQIMQEMCVNLQLPQQYPGHSYGNMLGEGNRK